MRCYLASIAIFVLGSISVATAAALVTVNGKLSSITDRHYLIETPNAKYYIKRELVSPEDVPQMQKLDSQVTVSVAMEAIELVREKQKSVSQKK